MLGYTLYPKLELRKQIEKKARKYLFPSGGNLDEAEMTPEQQGLLVGARNRPLINRNNDS